MNEPSNDTTKSQRQRIYFLDNLKSFLIFLVVLNHAGVVYESSGAGASFWIVDDAATNHLSGIFNLVIDIFVMSTFFFVSGFFTPLSLKNKNASEFLCSKFKRLIIPWAIAVVTLMPLYKMIFLYSRGLPQENWTTYFHFSNGIFSQSWLWFLPVLFLFDVFYLTIAKAKFKLPNVSVKTAILSILVVGFIYSVVMDFLDIRGWTKTPVLDFQNERLLIYFMVFLLGAYCFNRKVFQTKPAGTWLYHTVNSIAWIPITVYIFFLLYPYFNPGEFILSETFDRLIRWFSFHLSLLSLMLGTIETFRRYFDKQGPFGLEISRNSYLVYIIHVIVLGVLALMLQAIAIPSLAKYIVLAAATFIVSHLAVSSYRVCVGRLKNPDVVS